ncbi:hypothetical protein Tco_0953646 [Tanacetum coccineum]|uniref:Uncharacterized protein n=1 Tax=Tanacetum coccineum TaxID=301880 RepID=A0ABQ5E0H3_9ASTR
MIRILVFRSRIFPCCARCGTPVDGPSCRGCAFLRKKFDEDLLAYCVENGMFKDFQNTSESSDDNTNVVNALREPSVVDQDPGHVLEMLHAQRILLGIYAKLLDESMIKPHNEKSIKLLLAEEKFLKIKQVVEEEQTQPEYLQELLQSLLTDLQILNEIQPLKQETLNQISERIREKKYSELLAEERFQKANQVLNESQSSQEMRIQDLEIQKQQCLEEIKEWMNDLGIREYQKEEIDIDYRRKCEDKIYELKDKFNGLSIEIRKIIQEAEELRESEARARIQKIIIDDDDDNLGFYAVHPNTIHTPVSQNVEPKDSLIMGDGHFNTTLETETISVETLVSNPSESDDFSLGECNLFDIDDSYYEKSTSRLAHLAPILPEIVEVCVDDDDTDDDDDYDDDFYDCVDIEEDGGEIDLDISKIDTTSIDALPLDDSMILSEYESFTFDDEPVMAEVNVFDEINTSELSYPGIGENVVLDEEEDSFTFTIRSFLPFVTYPEVLPVSYSTGSEDKVFKPGIFDNVLTRKSSLTLDVFDPLHRFSGFWKIHGSKLWKDKAIPTISIDGLQSSLHK